MIKRNRHYSVYGVFLPTDKGHITVNQFCSHSLKDVIMQLMVSTAGASGCSGKGSHIRKASKTTSFWVHAVLIHAIRTCTSSLSQQSLSKVQRKCTVSGMTYSFVRANRTRIEISKWRLVGKKENVY